MSSSSAPLRVRVSSFCAIAATDLVVPWGNAYATHGMGAGDFVPCATRREFTCACVGGWKEEDWPSGQGTGGRARSASSAPHPSPATWRQAGLVRAAGAKTDDGRPQTRGHARRSQCGMGQTAGGTLAPPLRTADCVDQPRSARRRRAWCVCTSICASELARPLATQRWLLVLVGASRVHRSCGSAQAHCVRVHRYAGRRVVSCPCHTVAF